MCVCVFRGFRCSCLKGQPIRRLVVAGLRRIVHSILLSLQEMYTAVPMVLFPARHSGRKEDVSCPWVQLAEFVCVCVCVCVEDNLTGLVVSSLLAECAGEEAN